MTKQRTVLGVLLIVALLAPGMILAQPVAPQVAAAPTSPADSRLFIENAGQWPGAARFQVWGGPGTMWLANDAIWITILDTPLPTPDTSGDELPSPLSFEGRGEGPGERGEVLGVNLKLSFVSANPQPAIEPSTTVDTKVNYFLGSDPTQWRPEVPVWSEVRYHDLYPGVDLVLGDDASGALPWKLEAQPGAESSAVRLRVEGADSLQLDGRLLRITTAAGELALPLPAADFSYQVEASTTDGRLLSFLAVPGEVTGRTGIEVLMHTPSDNPAELMYSTFLGGNSYDYGEAIALDSSGRASVTGWTTSDNFPTTPGAFDRTSNGSEDAFVLRLNAAGNALDFATFFGGSSSDRAFDLALDGAGRASLTGWTSSSNFPTTPGAFDRIFGGGTCLYRPCSDAFVVRLNATGSALVYATFLGGTDDDSGSSIALDSSGRASLVGSTQGSDFPTTPGAFDRSQNGGYDAFVARLNAAGSTLEYATFLGGNHPDHGYDVALDNSGRASVTGWTTSSDFPTTPSAFDRSFSGVWDAFVVRLNATGSALDYATFLGGDNYDDGAAIALDSSGRATVTGYTDSSDFPTTPGAFDPSFNGGDAFVVRLNASGSALDFSTFLGGGGSSGLALDSAGRATVTGQTGSSDFPITPNAFDRSFNGGTDAYVAQLNSTGSALVYSTFLGGSDNDGGNALTQDSAGRTIVTGLTYSDDFPTTPGAFDRSFNGETDALIAKLAMGTVPMPTETPTRTPTPTATPTSTPTPTFTPLGPWAAWHAGDTPLLVPPNGVDAVIDYGNMATPVPFAAHVSGASLFDTGTISGTTTITASLPTANGSYPLSLIPSIGATTGQTLTVLVDVGPVTLTKDGWISQPVYLPLLLRR